MASSLVAAIRREFGITAKLKEGHDGIYEVTVNGNLVYTNQSTCASGFPTNEDIFQEIGKYKSPLPAEEKIAYTNYEESATPFCSLPPPIQEKEYKLTSCGCLTDTTESVPTDNTGCCSPSMGEPAKSDKPASNNCCG